MKVVVHLKFMVDNTLHGKEANYNDENAERRLVDRLNSGGCQVFFDELGTILCRS